MVSNNRMMLTTSRAKTFGAVLAIALFCAAGTAVAASPVVLGYAGANSTDSGQGCTAYGYSVTAVPYTLPFNGVLTRYQFTTGDDHTADTSETVRLRTVHSNGSLESAYVASEGAPNSTAALPTSAVGAFDARVPGVAGDHLAIGTSTGTNSAYVGLTHCTATAPSETGRTGFHAGAVAKDVTVPWIDAPNTVPNVRALLEPDADEDGYGDGSQDLCPDKASVHSYSCTGALYGTNTALTPVSSNLACAGFNCLRVQTAIGGVSTAAPYNGVIVRWRATSNTGTNMRIRVVKATDSSHFQIVRSSDAAEIPNAPQPPTGLFPPAMTIVPARVPIEQGDFIGLDVPNGPAVYYSNSLPSSTYYDLSNAADGSIVGAPSPLSKEFYYNADIERDADGDGYGDETQDLCPTDPTRQTECLVAAGDTTKPVITGFKASPKKFRVSTKGAVITKRVPKGTKFKLKLSEKSTVTFTVYRIVKKKSRKVHSFTRSGKNGSNSFSYSGRYRPAFKTKKLTPGKYKVKAYATDAAGNRSSSRTTTFTLVR